MNELLASRGPATVAPAQEFELPATACDGTAAVAALYADPEAPQTRAVFFDDGRYMCWNEALVIRGTYEVEAGTVITAALDTLDWDSATGRLRGARWNFTRLGARVNALAREAAGRRWIDLEEALHRSDDEIDAAVADMVAGGECEPAPGAPSVAEPLLELVGAQADTWQSPSDY